MHENEKASCTLRETTPPKVCNRPIQSGRMYTKLKINLKKPNSLNKDFPKEQWTEVTN